LNVVGEPVAERRELRSGGRPWNRVSMCRVVPPRPFRTLAVTLIVAVVWPAHRAWACSSCGCTLSSDWVSQGYTASAGFRLDLRFDYFDQDVLRSGTASVDRHAIALPPDREIQRRTLNRNTNVILDYSPTPEWGVNVQVPAFDRFQTTVAPGDTAISSSHAKDLGDVRVLGRFQGFSPDRTTGVQFGLKLATGRIDNTFVAGPQKGADVDRGLQPGTGTTDVLLGAYHFGALGNGWTYFAQALVEQPLDSRDGFRPGTALNLNVGVRSAASRTFSPQLQLAVRAEERESGPNADVDNSGATLAYLGPGVALRLAAPLSVYAFLQIPIYERVNGYQLEPRYLASVGLHVSL
jgi:hypothetical protein